MNKLELVKAAGEIVVSIGVGAIVNDAIKATTPGNLGVLKRATIVAGSVVLTSMVSDQAVMYVERKFDETVKNVTEFVADLKKK